MGKTILKKESGGIIDMRRRLFPPKQKGIKKWYGELKEKIQERKQGITIEGIEYKDAENGNSIFASYQLIPIIGKTGLYRVEELMMSEKSYRRKVRAREIKNEIEREKYLAEKPVNIKNTRRMYMTADYSVIQELRNETGLRIEGEAVRQFKLLVERQRIKTRILESGDKIARAIYEEGRITDPRTLGYIGGLKGKKGSIERVYNLKDSRAREVNQDIFNGLLRGDKKLRDYYEEERGK